MAASEETREERMLNNRLGAINDIEGKSVPDSSLFIVDAHVHIFPDKIFSAVWDWFDNFGWPIRYKLFTTDLLDFLFKKGINHIVALQYAHKPGIAEQLNSYMAEIVKKDKRVTGLATVFPGENNPEKILTKAFSEGLSGVKLHSHVQCFELLSDKMDIIYQTCSSNNKPLVLHGSKEPKSSAYACDPYELCGADKIESILKNYPDLKLCIPHMGTDEYQRFANLLEKYDNLWVDTAMVYADYFPEDFPVPLDEIREDRVMYGSDFPNIPFAWDRELKKIMSHQYPDKLIKKIVGENAKEFFSI